MKGEYLMPGMYRCWLFVGLASLCLICGSCCNAAGGGGGGDSTAVVFSDIHFDPFYDPALFAALDASDPAEWEGLFRSSGITAPARPGSDTNFPLLALAMSSIRQHAGGGALAVFTGDLLGHNFATTYYGLHGSQDVAAMRAFADKTVAFVMDQVRASVGDRPVLFAVGNADSYSGVAPEAEFLSRTAGLFYTKFLRGAADHQAFVGTFAIGGYYAADLPGTDLTVISLNTLMLTGQDPSATADDVTAQLVWLDATLATAGTAGKRVWLLMHVPPGAATSATAGRLDSQGQLASAVMMWQSTYQADFQRVLSKHPGVVAMVFAGHTHMDEYRIVSGSVCHISPGISPCFGDNPAYKVFEYSSATFEAADYVSLNYDLAAMPEHFNRYYAFSSAYSMHGPLDAAMMQLLPELGIIAEQQSRYREYYYSGAASANSITDANWPVYWCAIGDMGQQELIDCVNSYHFGDAGH